MRTTSPSAQEIWLAHPPEAIADARARIGWARVDVGAKRIEFAGEAMAITLNGIAPGYAADRVAAWLADRRAGTR